MEEVHKFDKEKQHQIAKSIDGVVKDVLNEYEKLTHIIIRYEVYVYNVKSVGVQGDNRTYERAVELKLEFPGKKIDYDLVARLSTSITNQVSEVNRVLCNFF